MNDTYEKKNPVVVYAEPIKVEDAPLPFCFRAWEASKRLFFNIRNRIRFIQGLKTILKLALTLFALAAGPIWLLLTLLFFRKNRRTAPAGV